MVYDLTGWDVAFLYADYDEGGARLNDDVRRICNRAADEVWDRQCWAIRDTFVSGKYVRRRAIGGRSSTLDPRWIRFGKPWHPCKTLSDVDDGKTCRHGQTRHSAR